MAFLLSRGRGNRAVAGKIVGDNPAPAHTRSAGFLDPYAGTTRRLRRRWRIKQRTDRSAHEAPVPVRKEKTGKRRDSCPGWARCPENCTGQPAGGGFSGRGLPSAISAA